MELIEGVRLALQSLWANKMRSVLTLLGVVIGVASVIMVVTLTNGSASGSTGSGGAGGVLPRVLGSGVLGTGSGPAAYGHAFGIAMIGVVAALLSAAILSATQGRFRSAR